MKANERHHSARPSSAIKPNASVNTKPNYQSAEKAAAPMLSAPFGLDPLNSRVPTHASSLRRETTPTELDVDLICDPDFDPDADCDDEGRKGPTTKVY